MPNIPQFNLPSAQSKLTPDETGPRVTALAGEALARKARGQMETGRVQGAQIAQGYAALGRGIGNAGSTADDFVTQHDISSAAQQHTELAAKAATDLPKILATAADPVQAVKDYYTNQYQPAVDKINGDMSTKRSRMWAAEHSESGAQAFMRSGIAEAMNVQGARAIQSFQTSVNNLSVAAKADPHGLDGYIKQADSLLDGMKGTLGATQQVTAEGHRSNVHQQLAINAAHALADQNPQQFLKDLQSGWGADHITPQQREGLTHYANYALKHQNMGKQRASSDGVVDWATNTAPDPKTGAPKQFTPEGIGAVVNDPNISPDDKQSAARFGTLGNQVWSWKRQNFNTRHPAPHGNLGDEYQLNQGIKNGTVKIDDISDAMKMYLDTKGQRGISEQTAHSLMGKLKPDKVEAYSHVHSDPTLKSAREQAEEFITGSTSHVDTSTGIPSNPALKQKIRSFRMDVDKALEGAVDRKENWRDYLDPKNEKYLFARDKLQQYVPSKKELADQVVMGQKPNESIFLQAKPKSEQPAEKPPIKSFFQGLFK